MGGLVETIGQRMLLSFDGKDRLPRPLLDDIRSIRPAGITLFRALNVDSPAQVRELTRLLQDAAEDCGLPPLLIAADQEGGQLMAVGAGTTPLPGNLALGAAGSTRLARRAGEVLGAELAAMGINLNYAPCCDVNVNPQNPSVGTRSFGESPDLVAALSAALTGGIQSQGVAATAKHFPGHGDTAVDSHHKLAVLPHGLDRLRAVEFPPFEAAIAAGVKAVMAGHLALPSIDGREDLPATLSSSILQGLLRGELGFEGVIVSDALDMGAVRQEEGLESQAVQALAAGIDLLLLGAEPDSQRQACSALRKAVRGHRLDPGEHSASLKRLDALREWIGDAAPQPDMSVVGCARHMAVASEIAERSVTLVRDERGWLPLRPPDGGRVAVIVPRPVDQTPADTSSYESPALAQAMRRYYPEVDEFLIPHAPGEQDISALLEVVPRYARVVVATMNAYARTAQATLVRTLLRSGVPVVVTALRMPYDLTAFPEASTYVCSYSLQEPSMQALARALWGKAPFLGRLPVGIPGMYPVGHGQSIQ